MSNSIDVSLIRDAIFNQGDALISAKVVELAIMISDKKDTLTINKNIDNVLHYMKTAITKLGKVKQANQ